MWMNSRYFFFKLIPMLFCPFPLTQTLTNWKHIILTHPLIKDHYLLEWENKDVATR